MKKTAIAAAVISTLSTFALSAQSFDARSVAMGGIGATTANNLTAPFHNPALAAKRTTSDGVSVLYSAFGLNIQDKGEIIDGVDKASDTIKFFESNKTQENASATVDALANLRGDNASVQAGIGIAVMIPNNFVSVNLFTQAYLDAYVIADIAESDLDESALIDPNHQFTSTSRVAGVAILEFGAALAKEWSTNNGVIYYGLTPKIQQIETINYASTIDNFEMNDFNSNKYTKSQTAFNMDAGIAYAIDNGFVFGLAGKNLITQDIDTVSVMGVKANYSLNPVFTASASYGNRLFTIGADVDLNETERFESFAATHTKVNADSDNTQLAGIGAEFSPSNWVQLRAGYQTDIANNLDNQFTAGLGLSAFDTVHIDLAGSYASKNQLGVSLEASMTF